MRLQPAKLTESLALKYPELEMLNGYLYRAPKIPSLVRKDLSAFFQHKVFLQRELRAQSFKKHIYPNTNIGKLTAEWYGFRFLHRYSRQGDALVGESLCKQMYPAAPASLKTHGFFLNSGQAATHTALMALTKRLGLRPDSKLHRVYFETSDLMDRLPERMYLGSFEFQDSSAMDFSWDNFDESDAKKILLFDTTCIDRLDLGLKKFLKKVQTTRRPVILVRSCLKLDSFGAEYGTLGSLLILNPESFPRAQDVIKKAERDTPFSLINEVIKATGAVLGHFTSIDSVYPFLTDPEITRLNADRVKRLQNNTRQLCAYLLAHKMNVRMRPHGLFCELPGMASDGPLALQKRVQKIGLLASYPIHFADSFGLDVSTVSSYQDFYDPSGKTVLRIAPADLCEGDFAARLELYGHFVSR